MDVHQNAGLTLRCRELLVERVSRGRSKRWVAAEFGISVKSVTKWVRRFQAEGSASLRDRFCRPQPSTRTRAYRQGQDGAGTFSNSV